MNPKALLVIVVFCNVQKGARQPESLFRPATKSICVLPPKIALSRRKHGQEGDF